MGKSIGSKLKQAALVVGWTLGISLVLLGLTITAKGSGIIVDSRASMMFSMMGVEEVGGKVVLIGFLTMAFGALSGWVSYLVLYGFGELVNNSALIAKGTCGNSSDVLPNNSAVKSPTNYGAGNNDLPEL